MMISIESITGGYLVTTHADTQYSKRVAYNFDANKQSVDAMWTALITYLEKELKPVYEDPPIGMRDYAWRTKKDSVKDA